MVNSYPARTKSDNSALLAQSLIYLMQFMLLHCKMDCSNIFINILDVRDGPFDIQGGWDFSSRQVIFFSLFAQQVIFFQKLAATSFLFF